MSEFKQSHNSPPYSLPVTFFQCLTFTIFMEKPPLCSSNTSTFCNFSLRNSNSFLITLSWSLHSFTSRRYFSHWSPRLRSFFFFFFCLSLPHRLQNRALSNRAAYLEVERECGTQAMCAEKSQVMCAENADF